MMTKPVTDRGPFYLPPAIPLRYHQSSHNIPHSPTHTAKYVLPYKYQKP